MQSSFPYLKFLDRSAKKKNQNGITALFTDKARPDCLDYNYLTGMTRLL